MLELTVDQLREEAADREAIRDCLFRYARGVDRCDEDMIRSAYWPDATDDHIWLKGKTDEFVAWSITQMRKMDQNVHLLGNIFIRLNGAKAKVETYGYGIQRLEIEGVMRDVIATCRYLDHFERRDGCWRIAERRLIIDWFREHPDSADWDVGPFRMGRVPRGELKPHDASYDWLGLS